MAGRGQNPSPIPRPARAGGGAPNLWFPRVVVVGGEGGSRPLRCLATARPAPLRAAAGACPQHGLARLACAVPVGRQLRAAALCPHPAPESPQLPSAADPSRPVHGAQQAAAFPNRVSAGLPRNAWLGKAGALGKRAEKRRLGEAWVLVRGESWGIQV